ncbi:6-hydroxynicotinate 3-monooxygenase [Flavobacterium aquidurense]|uniref:Flavin-dependent monooxygenase n=1 Tax=Flavobacterium frigidimaris TaxID=262320 RepID=A0ABX4BW91_FLAFR|nr:NAD(P)/FAD-dependent oxidoreductase [Flavobacterium frigidimaris]OXA82034.1 tetracycline resistance protein [Flavobacterium frigidimaris]SDY56522.1 6-hydroxynicotinate 3-monooxygenase [Flavobacterium aquidurense]
MLLKDKKVAIIGGGPVGLTTARLLQQKGVNVTVYEWDTNAQSRISGGTLDIHKGSGQLALEKAGLLELYYYYARPTGERSVDMQTNILEESMPTEENKFDRPEIDRNDLRKILLDSLDKNTVEWNSKLTDIEKVGNQYHLKFKNGKTALSDFVIIANGGKSKARKFVTDIEPKYTGTYIIQGEVLDPKITCPSFKNLCKEENTMALAERKMLFSQVKSNGALNYYLSFQIDENWTEQENIDFSNKQMVLQYLNKLFVNWHPTFKELFNATDNFVGLPMRRMHLDKPWQSQSDITLAGDAAHVMPAFAGIGVNIGLLDALHLAANLTEGDFPDLLSAVKDYERKMIAYAIEAQEHTQMAEEGIHSDESFEEGRFDKEEWDKKIIESRPN